MSFILSFFGQKKAEIGGIYVFILNKLSMRYGIPNDGSINNQILRPGTRPQNDRVFLSS